MTPCAGVVSFPGVSETSGGIAAGAAVPERSPGRVLPWGQRP